MISITELQKVLDGGRLSFVLGVMMAMIGGAILRNSDADMEPMGLFILGSGLAAAAYGLVRVHAGSVEALVRSRSSDQHR